MSTYSTTDLALASYILSMGAEFPRVTVSGNGRCAFEFSDEEGGVGWLAQEWSITDENRAQCSAPKLFASLQKLRNAMNEVKSRTPYFQK